MLQNGRGSDTAQFHLLPPSPRHSGFTDASRILRNRAGMSFTGSVWKMTAITLFQVAQQSSFDVPDYFLQARIGAVLRHLWVDGWIYMPFVF